ncbi:MAG: adenylate/guanylate cyclase domain-containing protein [Dehalococcoidia bacterium]
MDPRIQYATSSDGVSLAYWTLGDGPALVNPPPASPWSHAQMEWQIPEWRHWYEHLIRDLKVVRYDNRGAGLSDRDADDCSLESNVRDLEAIVDTLGLQRFALFGIYYASTAAIAYAARHPERVTHLILWCGFARQEDAQATGTNDALRALLDVDWTLFTETLAHSVFGWSQGAPAHRFAEYMRASTTPEMVRKTWMSNEGLDLLGELPKIQAPTLVMHRRQFPFIKLETARDLAARISNSELVVFEGDSVSPYLDDMEDVMSTILDFMGVTSDGARTHVAERSSRSASSVGFRTIMFTDMEGSTEATQRLGDAQAQSMVRRHNEIVRDALHAYGGTEVKHTGDGIMSSFPSSSLAVECAVAIQRAIEAHSQSHPDEAIRVRIGLNAGEPVAEGDDLFGTAVQLASRICSRAEPRQVLVSDVVRQLVAGKGFLFGDRGETELRGFEDPVRIFEVRWQDQNS